MTDRRHRLLELLAEAHADWKRFDDLSLVERAADIGAEFERERCAEAVCTIPGRWGTHCYDDVSCAIDIAAAAIRNPQPPRSRR